MGKGVGGVGRGGGVVRGGGWGGGWGGGGGLWRGGGRGGGGGGEGGLGGGRATHWPWPCSVYILCYFVLFVLYDYEYVYPCAGVRVSCILYTKEL